MEYGFKHSLVVMGKLAQATARTPPSEDDLPLEYVDRSLSILGRTFDIHNQRIQLEFLGQREFIASQFREVDKRFEEIERKMDRRFQEVDRRFLEMETKMDRRFQEMETKMDRRFQEMEMKIDRRFQEVDRRFEKVESEIQGIKIQLENGTAIARNGRLRRMHQPINLIKVLKPTNNPDEFIYISHPQVPKHMKNLYILGQRAKGIFEPGWGEKPKQQKAQATQNALHTISELAKFYDIVIYSDNESESDATEMVLQEWSVDEYMEALLAEWGMDWQRVLKLGMQIMQDQPQQAGVKRPGEVSSRGEKKTRGGREQEAD